MARVSGPESAISRAGLDQLWAAVNVIEIDDRLMVFAANVATSQGLRTYAAAHCAAATALQHADVVAAAGDARLLAAWGAEGITVVDVNA